MKQITLHGNIHTVSVSFFSPSYLGKNYLLKEFRLCLNMEPVLLKIVESLSSLGRWNRVESEQKHVFGVVASPSVSKWRQFHIQARLRNLHTKFQLNWLK